MTLALDRGFGVGRVQGASAGDPCEYEDADESARRSASTLP